MSIPTDVLQAVAKAIAADHVVSTELIQPLWGGYGELFRATLSGSLHTSVIVKHIKLPQPKGHPRGWNTSQSHQRKLTSYQVELYWYQHYANDCLPQCSVPKCLYVNQQDDEILLIMEDLATLGFTQTFTSFEPKPIQYKQTLYKQASHEQIEACLSWLAYFHAQHLSVEPHGLWECGSYWHLATRPDELVKLTDVPLQQAAKLIDHTLQQCQFQTLIHGDAKLANFCFTATGEHVAAVDFQYVGKGCGMKDVILLLSSCVPHQQCDEAVPELLNYYFKQLQQALTVLQSDINPQTVEDAWRPLYCVAWADFQRFMKGWSPTHWKINHYTEALTQQALAQLNSAEQGQ
ncbi:phosphotransferase [Moritella marina ATCC 15381]|uniref:Phosphotransferase n=1 Tax=Moritella marina ATCC 15381 TaxID=1202962 RepID=A0A5J6WM19_MORMI|nr:phosphotransferase [Moritella marina]QFI38090.1 phosphotransferase [Moritella marina ATCC 15381]